MARAKTLTEMFFPQKEYAMPEQTRTTVYLQEQDRERLARLKQRYGLGVSAAVRVSLVLLEQRLEGNRHAALMNAARRENMDDWRMTTDNREAQVEFLRDLAANLTFGSDDPTTSAQDRVDYYCEEFANELPEWFDDHDKALLVRFMGD